MKNKKIAVTPMPQQSLHKAVFFNRDGTIIYKGEQHYVYRIEDVVLNEGVAEGLRQLQQAGYLLFIVTNQGGIAKGVYTHEDVKKVHDYLRHCLAEKGITISEIYYCPHHESIKTCVCRKPSPYMINLAIEDFHIDRHSSYLIGNNIRDIKAAEAAGIKSIKIHKNQSILPAINKIAGAPRKRINMNLDESEF